MPLFRHELYVADGMRVPSTEKEEPDNQHHRNHVGNGEFEHVTQKGGRVHFLLIRNGFDHEVGAISDVGVRSKENRRHTDGYYVLGQRRVLE